MRVRIKSEKFPSKGQWLRLFSGSKYYCRIITILDVMYSCLKTNASTIGFALVHYQFEDCKIILHNQAPYGWVLEIDINP